MEITDSQAIPVSGFGTSRTAGGTGSGGSDPPGRGIRAGDIPGGLVAESPDSPIWSQAGNALRYRSRVIARSTITRFMASGSGRKSQPAVKAALDAWFHEVRRASWNDFRLIASVDYRRQVVYIKWIGSHSDYDSIDAKTVQYED